jgi:hypothetical protein
MSFLHITNGDHARDLIARSGIPGDISIWADPLNEGPVPGGISDADLRTIRARFLAGSGRGDRFQRVLAELAEWASTIRRRGEYDETVLWFEHDLFDQLVLIQILDRIASTPSPRPLKLICIDRFPGHPHFKGLGELTPADLATLFDTRVEVDGRQIGLGIRAWRAFRGADPSGIENVLADDTSPLPFLGPALRRHLEEFPWVGTGVSRSERRLLELACEGPLQIREAFPRMHEGETHFYITDTSFWDLARRLAALDPPLLVLHPESDADRSLPFGTIEAAPRGRGIIAGEAALVERYEIDRWLGGVHLDRRSPMWWWDPIRRRLTQRLDSAGG